MPTGPWLGPAPCVCCCGKVFESAYRLIWRDGDYRIEAAQPCPKCGLTFRIRRVERVAK